MIKVNPEVHDLERKKAVKEMERLNMVKTKLHTEKLTNGKEITFKFQSAGLRETFKLINRTKDDIDKRIDELLEHVILTEEGSKVDYEFFEALPNSFQVINSVTGAAMRFLTDTDDTKE